MTHLLRSGIVGAMCLAASTGGAQPTRCAIDSMAPWAIVSRTWSQETGATWSNDSLRRVLLALEREDQERVLDLAKRAPSGEVPPSSLAMLEDRILTNSGKPQVHGTQFAVTPEGYAKFAPVAGPRGLAARRERAGLPPLDVYVCVIEESGLRVDRSTLPP